MTSTASIIASTASSVLPSSTTTSASGSYHEKPAVFKSIGITLAISAGFFIGTSFVLKKKGLLAANLKDGTEAGEGYGYLRNWWWWSGMGLMIVGEICNFAAYLFAEAILVTPLGALSVVITAILSGIFLKERLSFVGKIGCFNCIVGSTVIVMNAPKQSQVSTIQDMKHLVISPGFLSFTIVIIVSCVCVVLFAAPRWGNRNMLVYLSVCSLVGGLSVACIQGIGAAIIAQANGVAQFNQWFTYFLIFFVIVTLLVEIVYLNKALNIFNAAVVTPTYYVFFTSATIVTSAILFQGFKGSPIAITTVVMGFLQICAGVVLLQLSKSAKNVPDTEVLRGGLDQVKAVAEQEEPESEPKADAIRGAAAIIRTMSITRQKAEQAEAQRVLEDRMRDIQNRHLGIPSGEHAEWDGIRRRVTWSGNTDRRPRRNTTAHPPHGLARIPDLEEGSEEDTSANQTVLAKASRRRSMSLDAGFAPGAPASFGRPEIDPAQAETVWQRTKSFFVSRPRSNRSLTIGSSASNRSKIRVTGIDDTHYPAQTTGLSQSSTQLHITPSSLPLGRTITHDRTHGTPGSSGSGYTSGLSPGHSTPVSLPPLANIKDSGSKSSMLRPSSGDESTRTAKRQFSFQNIFSRGHSRTHSSESALSTKRMGIGSRKGGRTEGPDGSGSSNVPRSTEEELLGLVKGDRQMLREDTSPPYTDGSDSEDTTNGKEKGDSEDAGNKKEKEHGYGDRVDTSSDDSSDEISEKAIDNENEESLGGDEKRTIRLV